jgi:hypothetical protein
MDASVRERFRSARKRVEEAVNARLKENDPETPRWLVGAILTEAFPEITRRDPETGEIEIRLKLPYRAFTVDDPDEHCRSILRLLVRSVVVMQDLGGEPARCQMLQGLLAAVGHERGWL